MQLSNDGAVYAAAFSPDGRMVLTGCADNAARLWEATTGQPIGRPMIHPDDVRAVAFSPDGKSILTGCDDSLARLWDAVTGELLYAPLNIGSCPCGRVSPRRQNLLDGQHRQDGAALGHVDRQTHRRARET